MLPHRIQPAQFLDIISAEEQRKKSRAVPRFETADLAYDQKATQAIYYLAVFHCDIIRSIPHCNKGLFIRNVFKKKA